MKFISFPTLAFASTFLLSACEDHKTETHSAAHQSNSTTATTAVATDSWIGKWNGPEGTYLNITGGNGNYDITISNLDGPKNYTGKNAGREIQFERDGVKELIQATNGVDTGMKWLGDKKDCLTIHTGEGYCRD